MHQYETDKIVHVFAALGDTKASAVHHREHREPGQREAKWPDDERKKTQGWLRDVLPILEGLSLGMARYSFEKLANEVEHLPILSIITQTDLVRDGLEQELKQRKFFVLNQDFVRYYNKTALAGEAFKVRFPRGNTELIEAGNCLALDRFTGCVCHAMRAIEFALNALESKLGITRPPEPWQRSWGKVLDRIDVEIETRDKSKPVDWDKEAKSFKQCSAFLWAIKTPYRDDTFHVTLPYSQQEAMDILDVSLPFLRHVSEKMSLDEV